MAVIVDINPGFVADHIIQALHNCDRKTLNRLARKDLLQLNDTFPTLTDRSIRYAGLEAYAKAANVPLSYFFFGTHTPPVPRYTPYDNFVITQLNGMTMAQLVSLKESMYLFFPNPFYDLEITDYRARAYAVLYHMLPNPINQISTTVEAYKCLDEKVVEKILSDFEIRRLACYKIDTLMDVATFLGVNLHWLLNLKQFPLFCNNLLAEQIFSYYTLMPKHDQHQFITTLWQCINVDFVHEYTES